MMAVPGQLHYISVLIEKCGERGIECPYDLIAEIKDGVDVKRASEIIDELKFELGWSVDDWQEESWHDD